MSKMSLQNDLTAEITVSGNSLLLGPNILTSCVITEDIKSLLPTLEVSWYDTLGIEQQYGIFGDGVPVTVQISNTTTPEGPIQSFRMFNVPSLLGSSTGLHITFNAIADSPSWFRSVVSQSYKDTSNGVIGAIAAADGLGFDGTATNDLQAWLPDGKSHGQFCRTVADHGYAKDGGCLIMAVTENNTSGSNVSIADIQNLNNGLGGWLVRYKDITTLTGGGPVFFNNRAFGPNDLFVLNYNIHNYGGFLNNLSGYNAENLQPLATGGEDLLNTIETSLSGNSMNINSGIAGLAGTIAKKIWPFDQQNVHSNFVNAYHQNRRIKSTFSLSIDLLINVVSGIRLLDPVTVSLGNAQAQGDATLTNVYNGNYVVTGKKRIVASTGYYEKITVSNQGNGSQNPNMVGAS